MTVMTVSFFYSRTKSLGLHLLERTKTVGGLVSRMLAAAN